MADENLDRQIVEKLRREGHMAGLSPSAKAEIVSTAIAAHSKELTGGFTVITHRSIRIRQWREKP